MEGRFNQSPQLSGRTTITGDNNNNNNNNNIDTNVNIYGAVIIILLYKFTQLILKSQVVY